MKRLDILCSCEKCELRNLFFENVSNSEIEPICSMKTEIEHKKGEVIIKEGDEINEFLYLKQGLVKLYRKGSNNKEQIISIAKPFDFVSLLSVFSDTHYNYSVAAIEDSITCSLHLPTIKNLILNNGRFALNMIGKMSDATDKIIINFLDLRQKQLNGRIAYMLIYFAEEIYANNSFELPISRKEIAEFIGMTMENVTRTLSEFRKDKVIKVFGKQIEIVDKKALQMISRLG